jgi:hypothetical protein
MAKKSRRAAAIKRKVKQFEAAALKEAAMMQALRILPSVASCDKNVMRAVCSELRAVVDGTVKSAKPVLSERELIDLRSSLSTALQNKWEVSGGLYSCISVGTYNLVSGIWYPTHVHYH